MRTCPAQWGPLQTSRPSPFHSRRGGSLIVHINGQNLKSGNEANGDLLLWWCLFVCLFVCVYSCLCFFFGRCFKVYIDSEFWYAHSVEELVIWTVEREHGTCVCVVWHRQHGEKTWGVGCHGS